MTFNLIYSSDDAVILRTVDGKIFIENGIGNLSYFVIETPTDSSLELTSTIERIFGHIPNSTNGDPEATQGN